MTSSELALARTLVVDAKGLLRVAFMMISCIPALKLGVAGFVLDADSINRQNVIFLYCIGQWVLDGSCVRTRFLCGECMLYAWSGTD